MSSAMAWSATRRHASLDDPGGVAMLLGTLRKAGATSQATVLLDRDPAAPRRWMFMQAGRPDHRSKRGPPTPEAYFPGARIPADLHWNGPFGPTRWRRAY